MRPAASVVVIRQDGSEKRITRPVKQDKRTPKSEGAATMERETLMVMECAPYTASFNNLLAETAPGPSSSKLVALVMSRMRNENIPLNTTTYNLLMKHVAQEDDGEIFRIYEALKAEASRENASVLPSSETFRLLFRGCERSGQFHRAFLFYQHMVDLFHIVPDTTTYNTLLGYCAAARDVAQASYFVEEMREHGVFMDVNTYNCFMSSLVESAPYQETLRLFGELMDRGIKPTNRTYNTMLRAARVNDDYDRAFQLFEDMKKSGLIPDVISYNNLLWISQKRLHYVTGSGPYAHLKRTREQQIQGKAALAELVLSLLFEMEAMHVGANTFTYTKSLATLLACEDEQLFPLYQKAVKLRTTSRSRKEVLHKSTLGAENIMPLKGSSPHRVEGTSIRQAEQKEPASDVTFEEVSGYDDAQGEGSIGSSGVHPNVEMYRIMMKACAQMGHKEKCRVLYEDMLKNGLHLDLDLAKFALSVCEETKCMEWAEELMDATRRHCVHIDTPLYNRYLAVLEAVGDSRLLDLFEEMRLGINEFGAVADTETYNILLRWYRNTDNVDSALRLFDSFSGPYGTVVPNDATFCLMIQLYEKKEDVEAASQLVKRCQERKIPLGVSVYCEMMRLYAVKKDARVEELFTSLVTKRSTDSQVVLPTVDIKFYTTIMQYYLSVGRFIDVPKLFEQVKLNNSVDADVEVYTLVCLAYEKLENRMAMRALFDETRMRLVKVGIPMYNVMLRSFVNSGDSFVFDILADMKENRIAPENSTIAIFINSTEGRSIVTSAAMKNLFYTPPPFTYF